MNEKIKYMVLLKINYHYNKNDTLQEFFQSTTMWYKEITNVNNNGYIYYRLW